jgi:hypothetical protein
VRLLDRIAPRRTLGRSDAALSFGAWQEMFTWDGWTYAVTGRQTLVNAREEIGADYAGLASGAYKSNGIIFGIISWRMLVLSEGRFQWQELRTGRPGALFGDQSLAVLEHPWPGGQTGDLITRMELDDSLAGNAYVARGAGSMVDEKTGTVFRLDPTLDNTLVRLRPDWVTIFLGSNRDPEAAAWDTNATVLGYGYRPGGPFSGRDPVFFDPTEVAHWAPIPDPDAIFRGMSWLIPVIKDIQGDKLATEHKLGYFEAGGTPNFVVSIDVEDQEIYNLWVEAYRDKFEREPDERFKTVILGAGAKPIPIGSDLSQIEFKATQGAGETRLAVAGKVPPALLGISEGLQGSALNECNYSAARRSFADGWVRPSWRSLAGALETIVPPPRGATRLWIDERDVAFLREDEKDTAEIVALAMQAIRTGVDGGFTPESTVDAVDSGDLSRLVHTGLTSVQLYPGGQPNQNGNAADAAARFRDALRSLEIARQRVLVRGEGSSDE